MNMKKVLAVVMAVMLAISAMAISVFAAEYEITLSAAGSKGNGVAYSTVEFTIPVWAQYGYAVAGDSIKLSLPTKADKTEEVATTTTEKVPVDGEYETIVLNELELANRNDVVKSDVQMKDGAEVTVEVEVQTGTENKVDENGHWIEVPVMQKQNVKVYDVIVPKYTEKVTTTKTNKVVATCEASYVVVANGVSYALGLNADGVYEIVFGTLAHGWNDKDLNTVIPQSTVVGDNAALTVIGTFSIPKDADGKETYRVSAADFKYYTDPAENSWTNSKFTTTFWPTTQHYDVKAISNDNPNSVSYCWDWNPVDGQDIVADDTTWNAGLTNLKWDATLINKAQVIGAETAKVVLKLDKAIVGNYYFGLNAVYTNGLAYDLSSNYLNVGNETKAYAAYVEIEEPTDTIVFEIPKAVLYSTNYGVFNEKISIECIDFFHATVMDAIKAQVKAGILNGTLGDYSWTAAGTWADPAISFCGQDVNIYWNQWSNVAPQSVTLVLGYTDVETPADDIVVEDPVESTEEESEDITVEEPVEDTNPGTGLALAVVPMVLAAAAVVASKRR